MAEEDDREAEAVMCGLLAETAVNVGQAIAETAQKCRGLSYREVIERLHANLPEAMRMAAEQDPDVADDVQVAFFLLDRAFNAARKALDN